MTAIEALEKAREITRGTTCFVMPMAGRYQVCRRIGGRVIHLGYRSDPAGLLAYVRRVAGNAALTGRGVTTPATKDDGCSASG